MRHTHSGPIQAYLRPLTRARRYQSAAVVVVVVRREAEAALSLCDFAAAAASGRHDLPNLSRRPRQADREQLLSRLHPRACFVQLLVCVSNAVCHDEGRRGVAKKW